MYRYRVRPRGLTYDIKVKNRAWFPPGVAQFQGEEHPSWKGDEVSYKQLHRWVRRQLGAPGACEQCGDPETEWANRSHEYQRQLDDWIALCRTCHRRHDRGEARGAATRRYGEKAVQRG
jgi:hypothetical protein